MVNCIRSWFSVRRAGHRAIDVSALLGQDVRMPAIGQEKSAAVKVVAKAGLASQEKKSLRSIQFGLLSKSKTPLAARQLAEKVSAVGYQTKSRNWINVVSAMLSKMDNVQLVPGQGYRLKKR
jgi:hypothetical protein